ncbi:hypothetical protein LTR36_009455 [Oleoguttula mirabilis]|uniref:RNase III domain-containing protein n=1 Tax=Oleoguttula mirabilis TaxID=1507867 RepID=A0AAV9JSA9_9PEZI|nr:hypothetical protein LTR36_009455 [Oleoguttula mirabilis]
MSKRPYEDRERGQAHKKQRQDDQHSYSHDSIVRPQHRDTGDNARPSANQAHPHDDALSRLPPPTAALAAVPSYTPFTVSAPLPPLPDVLDGALSTAPFRHKSSASNYNRSSNPNDVTYEKLEFLGDAYLELLASRLLYARFPNLLAGQQSQLRELLVKNETLAEYARAYGFDRRVQVGDMERMMQDSKDRGNKGFNKVLGDVFEAYVAAVVLSDHEEGFAVAEKWMTGLWAPKLLEAAEKERYFTPSLSSSLQHSSTTTSGAGNMLKTYNPTAKAELQKRLLSGPGAKLQYEPYQKSVELKGDQLGQNRHFIGVYLTGYGYEKKLLGKGEGKNKVEAGNWAATEAMHGEAKGLVDECEEKLKVARDERRLEREAKEAKGEAKVEGKAEGKNEPTW